MHNRLMLTALFTAILQYIYVMTSSLILISLPD